MFTTSVLYHAARDPTVRLRLRRLDHAAIYLLIAGTYTPFTLGRAAWAPGAGRSPPSSGRWHCSASSSRPRSLGFRFHRTSVVLYVLMGWLAVVAAKPLMRELSSFELGWLVAGGLCYTVGVAFYLMKSRPYTHAIWHVFVLAGVASHFMAVLSITGG